MSSIITASDLSSYMNKTLTDAVAKQVVNAVNAYIESKTNRCWGDSAMAVERHDWKRVIYLRHQDVQQIVSVKTGYPGGSQSTYNPSGYFVNRLGRLTFFTLGVGFGALGGYSNNTMYSDWLEVTYAYGVEDVPEDLKLAALGLAAGFYNWAVNGQKEIVASQVGSYRVEYSGAVRGGSAGPDPAMSTANANWAVIDSYKTKRF